MMPEHRRWRQMTRNPNEFCVNRFERSSFPSNQIAIFLERFDLQQRLNIQF